MMDNKWYYDTNLGNTSGCVLDSEGYYIVKNIKPATAQEIARKHNLTIEEFRS
jgi:hypothetical protein|tara:strand:+ start:378 stop:536 length:159 start_codon:yes stop_codon:yes gene_type:complete